MASVHLVKEVFQLLHVVLEIVSHAILAVAFRAVRTEKAFLVLMLRVGAVPTLRRFRKHLGDHHALILLLPRFSVPGEAFRLFAETDGFGLSLELHHLLCQKFNYLHVVLLEQLHVVISEAQMLTKLSSLEGLSADIALDLDFGAVLLYMVSQLSSRHVLELLQVADVTAVLRTFVVLRVLLKRSNCHPSDLAVGGFVALVRELTEVNHVSYNWVDLLEQVVAFSFAMRALEFVIVIVLSIEVEFISVHLAISVLSVEPLGSLVSSGGWRSFKFHTVLFDEPFNQVLIVVLSANLW